MLKNPTSLVSWILKAKYFPHTSFLDASIPHNASYLWRSIYESKVVLKDGLRWRVGTGEHIKIWGDKWLPTPNTYCVISLLNGLAADATVNMLMCRDSMQWNTDLINQIFMPRDAEIIKAIPLSHRRPNDLLIWTGTKWGVFTVKSAYQRLLSQIHVVEASTSSTHSAESQLWTSI